MDHRQHAREFLVSRRAKLTPAQANLPAGTNRRVPGLRRSEVAALAGVSIEYYAKLERGALAVSAGVLDAIARALQLDDAERAHLFDLAHAADGSSALVRPRRRAAKPWSLRPSLQWTLDAVTDGPAFVRNGRMDLLAAEPGLTLTIYTAEPGSPSEEVLRLLASWTSTPDQTPAVSSDSNS